MSKIITKQLLYNLYVVRNLKIKEIEEKLNISFATIYKYLKIYGIPIKGIRHYLIKPKIEFTKEQYEFFDGLMAGDGSLVRQISEHHNRNAHISCKFKYKEFAEYINNFLNMNCNIKLYKHISDRYKGGYCNNYNLYSKNNILFTEERKRWYPFGKKIIPKDFRFSPISMNILYLCDGWKRKSGSLGISTQAFSKYNINKTFIICLKNLGIDCKMVQSGITVIPKRSAQKFLDFIGSCPVKCYEYKWDI